LLLKIPTAAFCANSGVRLRAASACGFSLRKTPANDDARSQEQSTTWHPAAMAASVVKVLRGGPQQTRCVVSFSLKDW